MHVVDKTKEDLATEVAHLRQRVAELEQAETEHKRAEDELRESEATARVLLNAAADVAALLDTKGIVLDVNEAMARRFGRSVDELIGVHGWDLIPTGIAERRKPYFDKAVQSGKPSRFEDESGGVWFDTVFYPVRDEQGKVTSVALLARDITDRKRAEEALRKSEEKYRTVVEISPDGIAIASKGRHVFANKSLAKIFGVSSPDELLGKPFMDYIHPDYRKIARARLEQQTKRGELAPLIEEKMLRADGTVIHAEVAAAPLKYEEEQSVLAVIRDITERKRAEEALRESEERFRVLFEGAPDAIFLTDPESGEIIDANSAASQLLLRPREEIVGLHQSKIHPPHLQGDEKKKFVEYVQYVRTKKQTHLIESTVVRSDGSTVPVEILAQMIHIKGRPIFQGTFRDITERTQTEEALRDSEERYRAIFEKSPLGIGMSSLDGKVVASNKAMEVITGYSAAELKKIKLVDTYENVKDREALLKAIKRYSNVVDFPVRLKRKDGTVYDALLNISCINLGGEDFLHTICQDITERKWAEEALQESEKRYRNIFEKIPISIIVLDKDGQMVDINPYHLTQIAKGQTPKEDFVGKNIVTHPTIVKAGLSETYKKVLEGEPFDRKDVYFSLLTTGADGYFNVRGVPLLKDDEVIGAVVIQEDITERKRMEEVLLESEEKYRVLFDAVPVGIGIADSEGTVYAGNQSVQEITGYTLEELKTIKMGDMYVDSDERKQMLQVLCESGQVCDYEVRLKRKDGTVYPVLLNIDQIEMEGRKVFLTVLRDITERTQAEKELQESEERFRLAFENANTGVCLVDLEGNLTKVNNRMCEIFGYTKEELESITVNDIAHPEDIDTSPMFIQKTLKGEIDNDTFEKRYFHKKGHEVVCQVSSSLIRDSEGSPLYFISHVHDITERKQAEEELRQSEERYRFLFENSQTINLLIGTDGKILDVNESAMQSLGYKKKSIIGKKVLEFVVPDHREEVAQQLAQELQGEYSPPLEIDIITKKETRTLLFTKGHATLFEKGELTGILLSAVDITERKHAEEKLRDSEERFRTICETAQDFIALKDRDCKFTYVNPAMERAFGIPASKLIGKTSEAIFGKERPTRIIEEDLRVLRGEIVDEEHPSPVEGNSTVQHIIKVPIRNSAGEIIGLCNIGRDITERKKIEEALRESEERYRTLVDNIDLGINLIDPDHTILMANASVGKRWNMSMSDMIGKKCFQVFEHRDAVCPDCPGVQTLATGQPAEVEHEEVRDDQGSFDVRLRTFPIFGQNGTVTGFTEIAEDITDRKQAEKALKESEEKYRLLSENIPVAVYSALPDEFSTTLFLSGRFLELTGYSSDYLLKNPELWTPMLHPEDRDYVWEKIAEHRQKKKLLELEYRIITKDNKVKWIRDRATPVLDENGALVRIDGFMEDISQRKQAEQALRESEEKYRSLVESSEDSIYLVDLNCNYIFLNDKHLSRLGMKSNQVVGRAYDEFHAPKESQDFAQKVKRVLKTGTSQTYEYQSQRDDRYFIRTLSPVTSPDGGVIKAITVISKDITERKEAEEKLKEREAFNYALFHYNPVETIVVDLEGRVTAFNLAKENSGDRLATIGDRMYKDYAGKHEIDMRAELMKCISSGERKEFSERKYGDKYLTITISPFSQGAIIISEDITERKRAEEALRGSEQFSSSLLSDSPNPIIVINPDTSIRYVNPALEKLTGFSAEELLDRKAPYPWWSDERISKTAKGLKRTMRQGIQRIENLFQTKSGEVFWVEITAEPVMHDGKVLYLLTSWIDITERKQAEELLQKERDTFYSILERAPYGVMVVDADGNNSFVNTEFTNITGYTLEDIPTTQEWWHRAYPDQHYKNMVMEKLENDYTQSKSEEIFRKEFGRTFSRAFNVICKDGTAKEIEFRTAIIADEGNIFMLSDITERQRMHALLETAAAEWRTTFDAINDAVCLLDPDGKIIRCNNAMLQVMGKPFSQITNHHCWEVIHGVSEAPHSCPIVLVGKTHHRETEVMFKDSRWFNISMDPLLDEDGNFIGGVHIMSDITDRMRIQNELQDSRKQLRNLTVHLEAVREQERTNIAREIHDELAQSLTALKMDVSWLDHRLPSDAQSLSEKTKSMGKLIDSTIQTVKRISAELRPGILDDLGLVAAIEWQAEEFHNRTGISCNVMVDPQDLTVDQDRSTAIFRIFQETLTNVARHARATKVTVGLKEKAGRLTLRVRDNGTGITEEQIADPQSFGLIGITERVHPWGGKVRIKGIPGKGTTVMVSVEPARSKNDIEKSELKGSPS